MKLPFYQILVTSFVALLSHGSLSAGLVDDFRLELQWRTQNNYDDYEAAIILYEQSHYRGRSLVLYPGEQIDNFDDYEWGFRVRSIEVIGPVNTILFDETGLWGHQLEVYHDISDLRDYRMRLNNYSSFRWHNRARSAYVTYRDPRVSISIQIGPGRIIPRIFCARPIIPRFYWIDQPKRYYHPRPKWYRERPVVITPKPRSPTYRVPSNRPITRPPSSPPPRTITPRTPSPPDTRPTTRPPSRNNQQAPRAVPQNNTRTPPSTRPPSTQRTQPPSTAPRTQPEARSPSRNETKARPSGSSSRNAPSRAAPPARPRSDR